MYVRNICLRKVDKYSLFLVFVSYLMTCRYFTETVLIKDILRIMPRMRYTLYYSQNCPATKPLRVHKKASSICKPEHSHGNLTKGENLNTCMTFKMADFGW